MSITFEASQDEVASLVRHFKTNLASYRGPGYKEAQARQEFIDPLFAALGWDVHNAQHAAPAYREVVVEASQPVEGHQRAPDYAFRIGRETKFYAEAKKPGIDLKADAGPAYQLRRYAWSARLPLSVLTDFEEFAAYDCRKRPSEQDKASAARTQYLRFEEYADRWREVWEVFSKEAVLGGAFDQAAGGATRRGASTVDVEFLKEIEIWRELLARNFALRNPRLSVEELNDAVQRTIDRIVFLRMAEDRGMEEYGRLERLAKADGAYAGLIRLARQANDKYNSGLFDFARDKLTPRLELDDKILQGILRDLYFPHSPYAFNVLPPEILGSVYERFLGKVIRLTAGHQAKVEAKPEVRKAGGVYYTPAYIVDYIVKQTVGQQIAGKGPSQLRGFRVLDMACGSGSFLLGAYQALLDHYLHWYSENSPEKYPKALYSATSSSGYQADPHPSTEEPIWLLTSTERKRVLTEHIFGVDIDRQAVEVTKLSLLLKVLEGETDETLGRQMRLLHDRALPDLDSNIQCGNSLIGPDYFQGRLLPDADELKRVNVFDWKAAFPEAIAAGGFDAIIGNPPWLMAGYHLEKDVAHLRGKFVSAHGKFDLYYLFLEAGLGLTKPSGRLGMIVPNKLFHTKAAGPLRGLFAQTKWLRQIVDFRDRQVFAGATNYSCILIFEKVASKAQLQYQIAGDGLAIEAEFTVGWSAISTEPWNLAGAEEQSLRDKLKAMGQPLETITARFCTGVQSGADRILVLANLEGQSLHLDRGVMRTVLRGRDVRRFSIAPNPPLLVFPYSEEHGTFTLLTEDRLARHTGIYRYLLSNKERLANRVWFGKSARELAGAWYGLMYVDAARWFRMPHILTPSLSDRSNFALGRGDLFATGTAGVTGIVPESSTPEDIRYLLGLLNSSTISYAIIKGSPIFSGGYYKFSAPYLKGIPIRRIDFSDPADKARHDKMVASVERMHELLSRLRAANSDGERELIQRQIDATDGQIDALVYELYGLTEEEIRLVEGTEPTPSPSEESETAS